MKKMLFFTIYIVLYRDLGFVSNNNYDFVRSDVVDSRKLSYIMNVLFVNAAGPAVPGSTLTKKG